MAFTVAQILAALEIHAPVGLELPRSPDTNEVDSATIERWVGDAAQKINDKRAKTTLKEYVLTTVADVQDYDLPSDCRTVSRITRSSLNTRTQVLGVPIDALGGGFVGYGAFGLLPSGQEVTGSIDLINRQRAAMIKREDDWEIFGGRIRLNFPVDDGEQINVEYRAIDRNLASLPDERFDLVLTYCLVKNLEWYIQRHAISVVQTGDSLTQNSLAAMIRIKADMEAAWVAGLNSIQREANG